MSNQQPKLDTPLKLKDIEDIAKAFQKAKDENPDLLPPGDHWQGNLSVDYYHGMIVSMNLAIRGVMNMVSNPASNPDNLVQELNLIAGQLSEMIVAKTPKIIMP